MTKRSLLLAAALVLAGCGGDKGSKGEPGPDGTPGPTGTPANAPTLSAIAPYHASPAMEVTITGTGFSATAAENVVYFGGVPGNVISATATEIVVNPAAGGFSEEIDVTVHTNGQTSNSLKFFLGAAGDQNFLDVVSLNPIIDALRLADGTVLLTANSGRIFKVSPAGVIAAVEFANDAPSSPGRMARRANGHVLVADSGRELVFNYDPATNDLTVFRLGAYSAAATVGGDAYLLRDGNVVDKVAANGTLTSAFHTFANCTDRTDLAAIGNQLFVGGSTLGGNASSVCWVDTTDNTVNGTLAPAVAGEEFTSVESLDVEGADLIVGGFLTGVGTAVAAVTPDTANGLYAQSAKTLALNGAGAVATVGGGAYLVSDGLALVQANATGWTVKAGVLLPLKILESEGVLYAVMTALLGGENYVVELTGDGSYRVVSSDFSSNGQGWIDARIDDGEMFVASQDEGIVSINLTTGAQALLVDRTAIGDTQSFTRDSAGNFFISNSAGAIDKYDAQGGNETLAFATGFTGSFLRGFTIVGTTLYVADTDLLAVDLNAGGAAVVVMESGLTGVTINSLAMTGEGELLGGSVNGTFVTISPEGFVTPFAEFGSPIVSGLHVLPDGRIVVADLFAVLAGSGPYALLP